MPTAATKQQILEDAGYFFSFDRKIYVNRTARKALGLEFVDDHREGEPRRTSQRTSCFEP